MDMTRNRRMSIELKRHYLIQIVDCYPKLSRKKKAEIINQFSLVTGMHRKAAILGGHAPASPQPLSAKESPPGIEIF